MGSNRFGIVHFFVDNSTEIVPDVWITQEQKSCYYPKQGTAPKKVVKLVKNAAAITDQFDLFECRVLKLFDTYQIAAEMLPKALYDSDLSCSETSRRPKQAPAPLHLPSYPIPNQAQSQQPQVSHESTPNQPRPISNEPFFELVRHESVSNNVVVVPAAGSLNSVSFGEHLRENEMICSSEACQAFRKDVVEKLEKISQVQEIQGAALAEIKSLLMGLRVGSQPDIQFQFPPATFPVQSMDALVNLNATLESNLDAFKRLVQIVRLSGGSNVEDGLKLALKEIVSDDIMAQHCYKGQSEKVAFIKYGALLKALRDGLIENCRINDASKEEIEKALPKILKQAADRVSQRKRAALRSVQRNNPLST